MDFTGIWQGLVDAIGSLDRLSGLSTRLVSAGVILLSGLLVAFVLGALARQAFLRGGRALSAASPGGSLREQDLHRTAHALSRVVFWLAFALAVMGATERMGLPVVTAWLSGVANYLPRILVAGLILIAGVAAGRVAGAAAARAAAASKLAEARRIGRLVELTALAITVLVAIEALGIDITFLQNAILVVLCGLLLSGGLAFGLGARDLVADILACHYAQRLYQPGQRIQLEVDGKPPLEGRLLRVVPPCLVFETELGEMAVPARQLTGGRSTLVVDQGP